jgi:hypothetical protein
MTNFDGDDIRNIRTALAAYRQYWQEMMEECVSDRNERMFAEFAELESRMVRVTSLTGEDF